MAPSLKELLHHSNLINARINAKPGEKVVMPELPGQEEMFTTEDDPFGGNENNRKAAEAVAKRGIKASVENQPSVSGDSVVAAAAVAKSAEVQNAIAANTPVDPTMKPLATVEPLAPGVVAKLSPPVWNPGK